MKNSDWLIVGLGNPGEKYTETRHNIGWMVALELADKFGGKFKKGSSIFYYSQIEVKNLIATIILPTTFMNGSGEAVRKVKTKLDIPNKKILIICDEYNFPLGKIHLKSDGSDGGHNGVLSVIEELHATDFLRLRCGIGKNFPPGGMVDYVLNKFDENEIFERNVMIKKSVEAIHYLLLKGPVRAMTDINSGKLWSPESE